MRSLERIAIDLALDVGAENVTVEMICDRALISPRTFYNYFASKEAAVFGAEPQPDPTLLEAFRLGTSRDVVGDLLDLLAKTAFSGVDPVLFQDRRRLLKADPSLVLKATPKFEAFVSVITERTLERLQSMGRPDRLGALREEASMIVALATAVMQRAMHVQLEADDDTHPQAVLDHSIALARRVLAEGRS